MKTKKQKNKREASQTSASTVQLKRPFTSVLTKDDGMDTAVHAQTPSPQTSLVGRAQQMRTLQREVGNARAGQMMHTPLVQQKTNNTGLPDNLKSGIETLSGMSMDDVQVHYNSAKPAQLQALAYTQGTDIHVAPGQEKHLPHEAWHVIQQKQGRVSPTMQMKGVDINDDNGLEYEAERMGSKALQIHRPTQITQRIIPSTSIVQRTILKEVVPEPDYYMATHHIADQWEIDEIANYYARQTGMRIGVLGSNMPVEKGEPLYVVAHGDAKGNFTKHTLEDLRNLLVAHGAESGMDIILAGCFTETAASKGLPTGAFQVKTSGFKGVLNVIENRLTDLQNTEESLTLHQRRTALLEAKHKKTIEEISRLIKTLSSAVTNNNSAEIRYFILHCPGMKQVTDKREIKFGNAISPRSWRGTISSWLNNLAMQSWRQFEIWSGVMRAMSEVNRGSFRMAEGLGKGADGSGEQALLMVATKIDTAHSKSYIFAEKTQRDYQLDIEKELPKY